MIKEINVIDYKKDVKRIIIDEANEAEKTTPRAYRTGARGTVSVIAFDECKKKAKSSMRRLHADVGHENMIKERHEEGERRGDEDQSEKSYYIIRIVNDEHYNDQVKKEKQEENFVDSCKPRPPKKVGGSTRTAVQKLRESLA